VTKTYQRDNMKRKFAVVITAIVVLVVVAASMFLLLNTRQPVGVPYDGTIIHTHGYDGAFLSLHFHSEKTLFSCQVTLNYTAINGTAVQIVKEIGVVDANTRNFNNGFTLNDFPIPASNVSSTIQFNETTPITLVTIKAIGYTTP
jgi:hypothetical protein